MRVSALYFMGKTADFQYICTLQIKYGKFRESTGNA